ncbi:PucR family transcriptional regulator ligand-binding domain-containing protein [Vitreoscilla massiliensis]|uniref:PucR family transcriptional regulator ligand-binding domain-containing protein n=1 Tax=Vitreoscilla massiliensis TaxID=1689272 RepID=A0ABY4E4D2_9NEIS|nr:PucR family transcriptional regulator ligand-binding domain-containing protein [Vitreoscilla massiliensis]UOO89715.1 PucR family transcriptional regulator ligand-binding domain-containing protein [Vitreoscilla massiliensis]
MITVQELVDKPYLGLAFQAGQSGGNKVVTWAHAVDLPDPWRWIEAGTLVMSTGAGLPEDAAAQSLWIQQLQQAQASALVFAPQPGAVSLTPALLAKADEIGLPVLSASFELEFVKLSRLVIEQVLRAQKERFDAGQRLFQVYADVLWQAADLPERLQLLGQKLASDLRIVDADSGAVLLTTAPANFDQPPLLRLPIPGRAHAVLEMGKVRSKWVDDPLLARVLAGLLGVELDRAMMARNDKRDEGKALLQDLIAGEMDFNTAKVMLERRGLRGSLVMVALRLPAALTGRFEQLHHVPELYGCFPLMLQAEHTLYLLINDDVDLLQHLLASLGTDAKMGISHPISAMISVQESVQQATLAVAHVAESDNTLVHYADLASEFALGPKTVSQAQAVVQHYLGRLLDYEAQHQLPLLQTLSVFLHQDGNWKTSAAQLNIHRQTLVYRLKLVEELTGIKPTSSHGISVFWLALQAQQSLK